MIRRGNNKSFKVLCHPSPMESLPFESLFDSEVSALPCWHVPNADVQEARGDAGVCSASVVMPVSCWLMEESMKGIPISVSIDFPSWLVLTWLFDCGLMFYSLVIRTITKLHSYRPINTVYPMTETWITGTLVVYCIIFWSVHHSLPVT